MSKKNLVIFVVLLAIIIDQASKIYVKTHFYLGEEIKVFGLDWFRFHFVENNGMAWGFEFGGRLGKLFLTLFRLVATGLIIYWLSDQVKKKMHNGVLVGVSLILAGAIGNIIDSLFYGIIFNTPSGRGVATLFHEQPYGEFLYGKVVDMLYFPLYKGESFTFFNAIFNVADSCVTVGVVLLIIFNKQAFPKETN